MPSPSFRASVSAPDCASSYPSQSSSSISDLKQGKCNDGDFFQNLGHSLAQRRLTRQRKLWHVSDDDIEFHFPQRSHSSPCSPDSSLKSNSSSASPGSYHWSFSAVPQPLPLPEATLARRPDSIAREGSCSPFWRWLFFWQAQLNHINEEMLPEIDEVLN